MKMISEKRRLKRQPERCHRGTIVIVDDAAKHLFLLDGALADRMLWRNGDALFNTLMGAREVVIGHKLNEDTLQMSGTEDQDMIQAFFAGRSDPAFSVRICVGRPEGGVNNMVAFGNENSIKGFAERAVIVVDQENERSILHR